MFNIRRVYVYVVTAVTLNAVAWAIIALLRNLLTPGLNPISGSITYNREMIALQLAIILIGLPIYLTHWLWAERLSQREEEERQAVVRLLYLYLMLTLFLAPFIANAYGFVQSGVRLLFNMERQIPAWSSELPDPANLVYTVTAMLVLAVLWGYHFWVVGSNRRAISDVQTWDTVHRFYIYLFSFAGLMMTSVGVGNLLRWLMFQVGEKDVSISQQALVTGLTALMVGVPLWLIFWRQAEKLYNRGGKAEQASALRKFYLYLVIFLAALGTVGSLTTLLAGLFKQLFSIASEGDVRNVLSVLATTAVIWAYHFLVLRQDTQAMPEVGQQAGVRRLYWYLIAGISLMALLIGIGGDLSVLIRSLFPQEEFLVKDILLEQLSWFSAVLIAGLAVWIMPWQKIQQELTAPEPLGLQAQQSWVRKIYLYFYLLLAALTFLGAGVFFLSQIVLLMMGGRTSGPSASEMTHAIAFALMAAAVWSYHIMLIRRDNKTLRAVQSKLAEAVRVVVVDDEDGRFGQKLIAALHQAIPNAILYPLGLTPDAVAVMKNVEAALPTGELLAAAEIIVGPWTMATPYVVHGQTNLNTLAAISASPAHKLLIPKPEPDWDWAGVDEWQAETAVQQVIYSVKQLIAGQTVKAKRGYTLGNAIAIGLVIVVLINLLPFLFMIPLRLFGN